MRKVGYNGLNELTSVTRGELDTAHDAIVSGKEDFSQTWNINALGNWSQFDDNGVTQTRTTDPANEISGITGGTVTPAYDLAGNMTTMPQPGNATVGLTCVYDAWDRLVEVSNGTTVLAQYEYGGAGRLVSETAGGTTTYAFYDGDEVIETRVGGTGASNIQYQYVWSLRGDKIPVLRDTYSGGCISPAPGSLSYRRQQQRHLACRPVRRRVDGDRAVFLRPLRHGDGLRPDVDNKPWRLRFLDRRQHPVFRRAVG